jgi:hypothetical protein
MTEERKCKCVHQDSGKRLRFQDGIVENLMGGGPQRRWGTWPNVLRTAFPVIAEQLIRKPLTANRLYISNPVVFPLDSSGRRC